MSNRPVVVLSGEAKDRFRTALVAYKCQLGTGGAEQRAFDSLIELWDKIDELPASRIDADLQTIKTQHSMIPPDFSSMETVVKNAFARSAERSRADIVWTEVVAADAAQGQAPQGPPPPS